MLKSTIVQHSYFVNFPVPIRNILLNKKYGSKAEFFPGIIVRKFFGRGISTQFKFSQFTIQHERTVLFFHEEIWDEEERFRLRYCLRFLLAYKKQSENTTLSTRYNALMNIGAVLRHFKLGLTYLRNSLVSDVDRVNSRFLVFLYFLTRVHNIFVSESDIFAKKRRILRNLFFIFIFMQERLQYFFGVTRDNPVFARRLLKPAKEDLPFSLSIFPKGLFLFLYSPYKTVYKYGSSKLLLLKYKTFLQRLDYSKDLIRKPSAPANVSQSQVENLINVNKSNGKGLSEIYSKIGNLSNKLRFISLSQINNNNNKFMMQCKDTAIGLNVRSSFPKRILSLRYPKQFKSQIRQVKVDIYVSRFKNARRTQQILGNILRRFMRSLSFLNVKTKFLYSQYGNRPKFFTSIVNFRLMLRQYYRFLNVKGNLFVRNTIAFFGLNSFFNRILLMPKALVNKLLMFNTLLTTNEQYQKRITYERGKISGPALFHIVHRYKRMHKKIKLKPATTTFWSKGSRKFYFSSLKVNFLRQLNLGVIFPTIVRFLTKNQTFLNKSRTYFNQLFCGFTSFKNFSVFLQTKFFLNSQFLRLFFGLLINYISFSTLLRNTTANVLRSAVKDILFLHSYSMSELAKSGLNSDLDKIMKTLMQSYRTSLEIYFNIVFNSLRSGEINAGLIKLRYIKRTQVQLRIIGQHNLRNLEFMKDAVKRLATLLKSLDTRRREKSLLMLTSNRAQSTTMQGGGVSKRVLSDFNIPINLQKTRIIQHFKSLFWQTHLPKLGYNIKKWFFRKNSRKLLFRRKVRKFLINILFLNKFVKEKRIMQSYYGYARRGMRISQFHKLASPFFLKLRLKRFVLFEQQTRMKRVANRFSFVTLSYGLCSLVTKFMNSNIENIKVEPFLSFRQTTYYSPFIVNRILFSPLDKSKYKSQLGNVSEFHSQLVFKWLTNLKISYFLLLFQFFTLQKDMNSFFCNLIEYFWIFLLFFQKNGFLLFLRKMAMFVNESWDVWWFLRELKQSMMVYNVFVIGKIICGRNCAKNQIHPNHRNLLLQSPVQIVVQLSCHRSFSRMSSSGLGIPNKQLHNTKTYRNLKTFKFIFIIDRFLPFQNRNIGSPIFLHRWSLVSLSLCKLKVERKAEIRIDELFINRYLIFGYLYMIMSSKWNQVLACHSNLAIWADFFPIVLYSVNDNNQRFIYSASPVESIFAIFAPLQVVGFFTFFYSTVRNTFANYSHFRFVNSVKHIVKRSYWRKKRRMNLKSEFTSQLVNKHVNFEGFFKRRPFVASLFFQKRIERRLHLKELKKQSTLNMVQNVGSQNRNPTLALRRWEFSQEYRFKTPQGHMSFSPQLPTIRSDIWSYFCRNKESKSRKISLKARSIGFLNSLTQSSIFTGDLALQIRRKRFMYVLDQITNRMQAQQYRLSKFQSSVISDFKIRWGITNIGLKARRYFDFDQLFVGNSGLSSVLLNLKFQRFCRLFVSLAKMQQVECNSVLSKRNSDRNWGYCLDSIDLFFDWLLIQGDEYFVTDDVSNFNNNSKFIWNSNLTEEFCYYDRFENEEEWHNCDFESIVNNWNKNMWVCVDIGISVLKSNELYSDFPHFVSTAIVRVNELESYGIEHNFDLMWKSGISAECRASYKSELISFFSLTKLLEFYIYVRNYKLLNNLVGYSVPLGLAEIGFKDGFLKFLRINRLAYLVKDFRTGVISLILSELFLVLIHKLFISWLLKLLKLKPSSHENLLVHELLEFVNYMCFDNLKNTIERTEFITRLSDSVKDISFVNRAEHELEIVYTNFFDTLINYKQFLKLNQEQKFATYERPNNFISKMGSKIIYNLHSPLFRIQNRHTYPYGSRSLLRFNFDNKRRGVKLNLVRIFRDYEGKLFKLHKQMHHASRHIYLYRRGLKQYLRRHKKRFVYQYFFQFALDRKLEMARNRQLRLLLAYIRAWGQGLFSKFRNSIKFPETKVTSLIPAKKRLKKKRRIAHVHLPTQLQRNPYDNYSKRIHYSARIKRARLARRHSFFKTKFPLVFKRKLFVDFFVSPRFFHFRRGAHHMYFSQLNLDLSLKNRTGLFFKLNRFLEFLVKIAFRIKLGMKQNVLVSRNFSEQNVSLNSSLTEKSFSFLFALYRRVKSLIVNFMVKLGDSFVRNMYRSGRTKLALNFSVLRIRFGFFYNYLSIRFFKFFLLRYFFFGDYIRARFQFIARYLWFRVVPLNKCVLNPKIFVIITKLRNNFFITGIDLFGRILYKTSPGIVGFTGTDRMSKYAWFDASVDFFDGFIEFIRYFLKGRKRKRGSFVRWRMVRTYGDRLHGMKRVMGAFFDSRKLDLWKSIKKMKKRRSKQKLKMRRFFVISKGVSDFNLRIFRKGMIEQRFKVSRFFAGVVNYPMKSFSLCRIKKVRRI